MLRHDRHVGEGGPAPVRIGEELPVDELGHLPLFVGMARDLGVEVRCHQERILRRPGRARGCGRARPGLARSRAPRTGCSRPADCRTPAVAGPSSGPSGIGSPKASTSRVASDGGIGRSTAAARGGGRSRPLTTCSTERSRQQQHDPDGHRRERAARSSAGIASVVLAVQVEQGRGEQQRGVDRRLPREPGERRPARPAPRAAMRSA